MSEPGWIARNRNYANKSLFWRRKERYGSGKKEHAEQKGQLDASALLVEDARKEWDIEKVCFIFQKLPVVPGWEALMHAYPLINDANLILGSHHE